MCSYNHLQSQAAQHDPARTELELLSQYSTETGTEQMENKKRQAKTKEGREKACPFFG